MAEEQSREAAEERLRVQCPHCGERFRARAALLGKSGPCPACHKPFAICKEVLIKAREPQEEKPEDDAKHRKVPVVWFAADSGAYCLGLPTDGWLRLQPQDETKVGAELGVVHPDIGYLRVTVMPWPMGLEEFQRGMKQKCAGEISGFRLSSESRTKVAGEPAVVLDYEGAVGGGRVQYRAHLLLYRGNALQIVAFGDAVFFPRLKKEAAVAIASFSFDTARVAAAKAAQSGVMAPRQSEQQAGSKEAKPRKAVLQIGKQRHPMFLNSIASGARELREHLGKDSGGLQAVEFVGRWWLVLACGGWLLAFQLGRTYGIVGLILLVGSAMWPLAAYQWTPKYVAKLFRRHLKSEANSTVPDPDVAGDDPLAYMGKKPLAQLQEALNRHWQYHERQASAQRRAYEIVQWAGPLRDVLLPLGIAAAISVIWIWLRW